MVKRARLRLFAHRTYRFFAFHNDRIPLGRFGTNVQQPIKRPLVPQKAKLRPTIKGGQTHIRQRYMKLNREELLSSLNNSVPNSMSVGSS